MLLEIRQSTKISLNNLGQLRTAASTVTSDSWHTAIGPGLLCVVVYTQYYYSEQNQYMWVTSHVAIFWWASVWAWTTRQTNYEIDSISYFPKFPCMLIYLVIQCLDANLKEHVSQQILNQSEEVRCVETANWYNVRTILSGFVMCNYEKCTILPANKQNLLISLTT